MVELKCLNLDKNNKFGYELKCRPWGKYRIEQLGMEMSSVNTAELIIIARCYPPWKFTEDK